MKRTLFTLTLLLFSQAAYAACAAQDARSTRDPAQTVTDPVAAQKKHSDSLESLADLADSREIITIEGFGRSDKPETEAQN